LKFIFLSSIQILQQQKTPPSWRGRIGNRRDEISIHAGQPSETEAGQQHAWIAENFISKAKMTRLSEECKRMQENYFEGLRREWHSFRARWIGNAHFRHPAASGNVLLGNLIA
jgi:hypothetical protein